MNDEKSSINFVSNLDDRVIQDNGFQRLPFLPGVDILTNLRDGPSDEELTQQMMTSLGVYETTSDPKTKYKAESKICRIMDKLGQSGTIYGKQGMNFASVKRDGEYRIPHLQKVISQNDLTDIALWHNIQSSKWNVSIELIPGYRPE